MCIAECPRDVTSIRGRDTSNSRGLTCVFSLAQVRPNVAAAKKAIVLADGSLGVECSVCHEVKSFEAFSKKTETHLGIQSRCKSCTVKPSKAYRLANSDRVRAAKKAWALANPDRRRARNKVWRLGNPDKARASTKAWELANPEKQRAHCQKRRALKRDAFVEAVDPRVVFQRDNGQCGICGQTVLLKLRYPHPQSASLDHIVPLAKGGVHSYQNTQLSHLVCNKRKNDSGPGQLRLFGTEVESIAGFREIAKVSTA